jgi:phosphoribosylaminoimidazole (AIR) synthetase
MLEGSALGITIDNPIDPPAIMQHVQELSGFSDERAYGKWHMGPGGVIATSQPEQVIAHASAAGIDGAKVIGEITDQPGIRIKNRGVVQQQEWLEF